MQPKYLSPFSKTCFAVLMMTMATTLFAARGLGAQASLRTTGLSIDSVVAFSALDGGVHDQDHLSNGVLTLQSLDIYGGGTIIIDVPNAEFIVTGDITLRGHSAIRVPHDAPEVGPQVTIHAGGRASMRGTSRLNVNGVIGGGHLVICATEGIELGGVFQASADGIGKDKRGQEDNSIVVPLSNPGGDVWLQSPGKISVADSARISTNGSDGGTVHLDSCDPSSNAIEIDGLILSLGFGGTGGSVDVKARKGGILFDHDDDNADGMLFGSAPAIIAKGFVSDGVITLTAGTSVNPIPPITFPEAVVNEQSPSLGNCTTCFITNPQDCNDDGISNEQEIAECNGEPSCDDCNFNGLPDECDIASGQSADEDPQDGVPDECSSFVAGGCSPPSDLWSCFDNWILPGNSYPDDVSSAAGVHVTLGGGDLAILDVDALIPTLRLLSGAILRISTGDLSFSLPATVLNNGVILVAGGRTIGSENGTPPLLTIGPGGLYSKDPFASRSAGGSETTAGLTVSDLILEAGKCSSPPSNGGVLQLDDSMRLHAVRDIFLRGSAVADCTGGDDTATRGGVSPPPKLSTSGSSSTRVGSSITLDRNEESLGRIAAPSGNLHLEQIVEVSVRSIVPMILLGDFDNRSTAPELFDWYFGGMSMEGALPQAFEVAGRDIGPTFLGIYPDADSNFAMGKVRIAAGSDVTFKNEFANTVGANPCDEAVYVRELTLEPGSHVTLDNCRVYYALGEIQDADVSLLGCAALVQLIPPPPRVGDDVCVGGSNTGGPCGQHTECPGGSCHLKNRFASFVTPFRPIGGAIPVGIKVTAVHLDSNSVNAAPDFDGRSWWVQPATLGVADGASPAFDAASLGCTFSSADLEAISLLHVYGTAIVPSSSYDVQVCTTETGPCSAALRVDTARWGDVALPLVAGQPSFQDIVAIVDKFLNKPDGPSKTRTKLNGRSPDPLTEVNFLEVSTAADAFRGRTFVQQFPLGPESCP